MEVFLTTVEIQFRMVSGVMIFYNPLIKGIMHIHMYIRTDIQTRTHFSTPGHTVLQQNHQIRSQ